MLKKQSQQADSFRHEAGFGGCAVLEAILQRLEWDQYSDFFNAKGEIQQCCEADEYETRRGETVFMKTFPNTPDKKTSFLIWHRMCDLVYA